jgi:uncharacterized protein (TIGR00297 family)
MLLRAIAGIAAAAAVALAALRARALTRGGALTATAVGTTCVVAGWSWAALLVLYFVVAVAGSRAGADVKARRTSGVIAKSGARDSIQVLANGGVFAAGALAAALASRSLSPLLAAAALGALAASAADTLATEIGTLVGGTPRSLAGWRAVPPGTSGGVTAAGTAAMIGGAALVALAARELGLSDAVVAVAVGGIAGAAADSIAGALIQARRWCPACATATEREVHDCGVSTECSGGLGWLDNDGVNLLATMVGAAVAAALARI